jgi:hypothetical protein
MHNQGMTNLKLTGQQIQQTAKVAGVDIRTMVRYLAGDEIRKMAAERIRAALTSAGLLVLLLVLGCSDLAGAPRTPVAAPVDAPDAGAAVEIDSLPPLAPDARPDTLLADLVLADTKPDARVLADSLLADTLPAVAPDTGPAMPRACEMQKVITTPVGSGTCAKYWSGTKIACKVGCQDFATSARMDEPTPCLTVGKDPYSVKDAWTGPVICLKSWDDCEKYCTTPIN